MTSGSVAVSLGNNEIRRKQTVAKIRAGGGGADIALVAPAPDNEVTALSSFPLGTAAAAASASGGGRRRRERSPLCGRGRCWATKSEGIEGRVSDENVARHQNFFIRTQGLWLRPWIFPRNSKRTSLVNELFRGKTCKNERFPAFHTK